MPWVRARAFVRRLIMATKRHDDEKGREGEEEPVDPGFGSPEIPTGENVDRGIRHRGNPPAPPRDAPVPPQQIPPEEEGDS